MSNDRSASISLTDIYARSFILRCHEFLALGYARLNPLTLTTLEEEDITGKLRDAMEAALDAPNRPTWATSFHCVEEQRESVHGRTGKRRPRIDICIACINPRPKSQFRFEAKRLRNGGSLSKYLGDEGMLALLSGYYGDLKFAAMIGYVQQGACEDWAVKIKDAITADPTIYHVEKPVSFDEMGFTICSPIFCSRHRCGNVSRLRRVSHSLLLCA